MMSSKPEPMAFSIDDSVSVSMPSAAAWPCEVDEDGPRRRHVGDRIEVAAAEDPVGAFEAAVEDVRPGVADDHVVEARADRVLDRGQRIAVDPVGGRLRRQIDQHAAAREGIRYGIAALGAVDLVRSAGAAVENVVQRIAVHDIAEFRAYRVLDRSEGVGEDPVGRSPAREIDQLAAGREIVGHRVAAAAAVDPVRRVAAHDHVVEGRADRVLDRQQRVGEDPVGRRPAREIDQLAAPREVVGHRVAAAAAVDPASLLTMMSPKAEPIAFSIDDSVSVSMPSAAAWP